MTVYEAKTVLGKCGFTMEIDREVSDIPSGSKPNKPRKPESDSQRLAKEFDRLLKKRPRKG